jgi:diaminopimelate epimerase
VAAILTGRCKNQVEVNLLGGKLLIEYQPGGEVFMTGPVKKVYEAEIEL